MTTIPDNEICRAEVKNKLSALEGYNEMHQDLFYSTTVKVFG
jgi:hypothetical protein